jgi:hypothetical protein
VSRDPNRLPCRALVVAAWFATLVLFYAGTVVSWGWTAGGMLVWSFAALPLAGATRRWLAAAGRPEPAAVRRFGTQAWIALVAGRRPSSYLLMMVLYAMFPIGVTLWGVVRSLQPIRTG